MLYTLNAMYEPASSSLLSPYVCRELTLLTNAWLHKHSSDIYSLRHGSLHNLCWHGALINKATTSLQWVRGQTFFFYKCQILIFTLCWLHLSGRNWEVQTEDDTGLRHVCSETAPESRAGKPSATWGAGRWENVSEERQSKVCNHLFYVFPPVAGCWLWEEIHISTQEKGLRTKVKRKTTYHMLWHKWLHHQDHATLRLKSKLVVSSYMRGDQVKLGHRENSVDCGQSS